MAFSLSASFLADYSQREVPWGYGALSYFTFKRTYARPLTDDPDGPTEEWWQTCRRVVTGVYELQERHCANMGVPWDDSKAQRSAQEMYERLFDFRWTPPGRGLWSMGCDFIYERGSACLNNCAFISTQGISSDFVYPFCWMMDMAMLGVGVGFDVAGAHEDVRLQRPVSGDVDFVVEDTREGWVDAVRALLGSYVGRCALPAGWDVSKVRPAGVPLRTFGGTASGPQPLLDLLAELARTCDRYIDQPLDAEGITDLMNQIGACVVAGGIRRTAQIALSAPSAEFAELKNYSSEVGQRRARWSWASNNSFVVDPNCGYDYTEVAQRIADNGEPGVVWLENARRFGRMDGTLNMADLWAMGVNPCVEQTLWNRELCCLVETYPSRHASFEDFKRTLKFAYLYAKTVTLLPTHCKETNGVLMRNRRIGLSISGIAEAIAKFGYREFMQTWCQEGYDVVRAWDAIYSNWFCVPLSIKVTSVKPSGTVSLLAGVTGGCHYPESDFCIRRVRCSLNSPLWSAMQAAGYHVEDDRKAPATKVISFPTKKDADNVRIKRDVSMYEQFVLAADLQRYWADNQVSITVHFQRHERAHIASCLAQFEDKLKAVSMLPLSEHGYEQAPYEEIDEETYQRMCALIQVATPDVDVTHDLSDRFCDGEACQI